jgi:hypothetical protein
MIFLKVEEQKVTLIHYMPFDEKDGLKRTQEELEQEGMLIDNLPEVEQIEGKKPVLYCNPNTKEVWYEHEDIQKTKEELLQDKVTQLENALIETQNTVNMLLGI